MSFVTRRRPSAIAAGILLSSLTHTGHAAPTIGVVSPTTNEVTPGDGVSLDLNVSSAYVVTSVTAKVQTSSSALVANASPQRPDAWAGAVDLSSFPRGAYVVEISATDTAPSTTTVTVPFVIDRWPRLNVTSPIASQTGPIVRYTASCSDDDPAGCASLSVTYRYFPAPGQLVEQKLAAGTSNVDVVVDFRGVIGTFADVVVDGYDSLGRHVVDGVGGPIRAFSPLCPVFTWDGLHTLGDFDATRMLLEGRSLDNEVPTIGVYARADGTALDGPYPATLFGTHSLFADVAVMTRASAAPKQYLKDVLELRAGSLTVVASEQSNVVAAHDRVVSTDFSKTVIRDATTGSDIATLPAGALHDIASNGDVVWQSPDGHIHRYRGADVDITPAAPYLSLSPKTDGSLVVFTELSASPLSRGLAYLDASGVRKPLVGLIKDAAYGPDDYAVEGGWILYLQRVTTPPEIHLRSPLGIDTKLALPPGEACSITALRANGTGAIRCAKSYEFDTSGNLRALPSTPVLKPFSSEFLYVERRAVMTENVSGVACASDPTPQQAQVVARDLDAGADARMDASELDAGDAADSSAPLDANVQDAGDDNDVGEAGEADATAGGPDAAMADGGAHTEGMEPNPDVDGSIADAGVPDTDGPTGDDDDTHPSSDAGLCSVRGRSGGDACFEQVMLALVALAAVRRRLARR